MTHTHDKKMQKLQLVWDHISQMPQGLKETDTVAMPELIKYVQNVTKHNKQTCREYAGLLTATGSLHLKVVGDRKTQWQAWVVAKGKQPSLEGAVGADYEAELTRRFAGDAVLPKVE